MYTDNMILTKSLNYMSWLWYTNVLRVSLSLQWLKQNKNHCLNSQKTPHTLPSRASYRVSLATILGELRYNGTTLYSSLMASSVSKGLALKRLHKLLPKSRYFYSRRTQIAKFMGPTWGPPGTCRSQMGPMFAPWTLLSGSSCCRLRFTTTLVWQEVS